MNECAQMHKKKTTQNQYTECAKLSIQTQIKYTE